MAETTTFMQAGGGLKVSNRILPKAYFWHSIRAVIQPIEVDEDCAE